MKLTCFADEISPFLSEQIRVLQDCNMHWLEFRSVWDITVLQLSRYQLQDIRHQLDTAGIFVSCIGSAVGKLPISTPLSQTFEDLALAADAAHILGTSRVRSFTFMPENLDPDSCVPEVVGRMRELAAKGREYGIMLMNENEPDMVGDSSIRCRHILDGVNDPSYRAVFDASNFRGAGEKPFDESLTRMLPYVEYLHIKDSKNGTNAKVVAGEGDSQLAEILNALRDNEGLFLSLEPHLSYAGVYRGFSGEDGFRKAHRALCTLLNRLEIRFE